MSLDATDIAIAIRNLSPDDSAFVFSSWLRNYRASSIIVKNVLDSVYFPKHHRLIESILARRECRTRIAYVAGDPHTIIGYLVAEATLPRPILHWIYVKSAFRRMGVATELLGGLDPNDCSFTHWTSTTNALLYKWPRAVYDPYLL